MNLTPTLNREINRVAKAEQIDDERKMALLMKEIADLAGVSVRGVYLYRSGRHRLPADVIPPLCERFGSLALLHALEHECRQIATVEVPDTFDLALTVSQTVRQDLEAYEEFMRDFESDGIQREELPRLRELMERVISNACRFLDIAKTDCDRRSGQAPEATERETAAAR